MGDDPKERWVLDTMIVSFVRALDVFDLFEAWLRQRTPECVLLRPVEKQLRQAGLGPEVDSWLKERMVAPEPVPHRGPVEIEAQKLRRNPRFKGLIAGNQTDLLVVAWAREHEATVVSCEHKLLDLCEELRIAHVDLLDIVERLLALCGEEERTRRTSVIEDLWSKAGSSPGRPSDWTGSLAETLSRRRGPAR